MSAGFKLIKQSNFLYYFDLNIVQLNYIKSQGISAPHLNYSTFE